MPSLTGRTRTVACVAMGYLLAYSFVTAVPCDDVKPNDTTMACASGIKTCSTWDGAGNQKACENVNNDAQWCYTDFPTKCTSKDAAGNNCNEPLSDCQATATCKFVDGKCEVSTKGKVYSEVAKKTIKVCK